MNKLKTSARKKKAPAVHQKQQKPARPGSTGGAIPKWVIGLVLVLTALVYIRSFSNGFITCWDDDGYILNNPYLRDFSWKGLAAIFSNFYYSNYHPLTTITYWFEFKLYGLNPLPYHVFNVLLHLFNVMLVYFVMEKLSGKRLAALIVAVLFAVHPMHVESVAWISERKDVLYTFFYLFSLLVYVRYLDSGGRMKFYFIALLLFAGSLLSKPAAVTLPVLLVAVDISRAGKIRMKYIVGKIPFFLLSVLFGILTILSQSRVDAFSDIAAPFGFIDRIFLFTYSVMFYIVKLIVPFGFSAMHYFPDKAGGALPWYYYASLPVLLVLAWLVIRRSKWRKEILFGVLFFFITISVMLQIVPVGRAHMAERYTYVPYIGLLFIAGQMISEIKKRQMRTIMAGIVVLMVAVFSYQAWDRIAAWKDGFALFNDVIKKNPDYYHGYYVRASLRSKGGDIQGALQDYNKAIECRPDFTAGLVNRGDIRNDMNDYKGALDDLNRAIKLDTTMASAYLNRGIAYSGTGNAAAALLDYNQAIRIDSSLFRAYNNRGILKAQSGDTAGALNDFNKAVIIAPYDADSYSNRGSFKNSVNDFKGALDDFDHALKLKPDNKMAFYNRGIVRMNLNDMMGACADWRKALELGNAAAQTMLDQNCR